MRVNRWLTFDKVATLLSSPKLLTNHSLLFCSSPKSCQLYSPLFTQVMPNYTLCVNNPTIMHITREHADMPQGCLAPDLRIWHVSGMFYRCWDIVYSKLDHHHCASFPFPSVCIPRPALPLSAHPTASRSIPDTQSTHLSSAVAHSLMSGTLQDISGFSVYFGSSSLVASLYVFALLSYHLPSIPTGSRIDST